MAKYAADAFSYSLAYPVKFAEIFFKVTVAIIRSPLASL
jgi:hypothetical protein